MDDDDDIDDDTLRRYRCREYSIVYISKISFCLEQPTNNDSRFFLSRVKKYNKNKESEEEDA